MSEQKTAEEQLQYPSSRRMPLFASMISFNAVRVMTNNQTR